MITVKDLNTCKKVTKELMVVIQNKIDEIWKKYDEHNHLEEDFSFGYENVSYGVTTLHESDWKDEGKYQYQEILYQLVSYDKNIKKWVCEESIINKFNLFFSLSVTRSGSYFSEYYYSYDKPLIQVAKIEHIAEQVIPAHDIVQFIKFEEKN